MVIAVAGGHGKIARHLARQLVQRGDRVRALLRNPAHEADARADGAEPVLCDLEVASEADMAEAIRGASAVVFAAGAGPGSGAARKWTVDYGGAATLIAAARGADIARYVMVSSMGADSPPPGEDVFSAYLQAKARADRDLVESRLDHTIVRPGRLTDDPPTGRVRVGEHLERGEIPRADVAAVLAAALHERASIGLVFELIAGGDPIDRALATLVAR